MANSFDEVAGAYADEVSRANRLSGRKHDFFVEEKARILRSVARSSPSGEMRFLDVGCGTGTLHPHMRRDGWVATGVDPSAASLEAARLLNPESTYVESSATNLPVPSVSFDLVAAICVLHHVALNDRAKVVAEMARAARSGGVVAVIEHHPGNPYTRYSVAHCPFDGDAILLRRREVEALLRSAGLVSVQSRYVSWTPISHGVNGAIERAFGRLPLGTQYVTYGRAA